MDRAITELTLYGARKSIGTVPDNSIINLKRPQILFDKARQWIGNLAYVRNSSSEVVPVESPFYYCLAEGYTSARNIDCLLVVYESRCANVHQYDAARAFETSLLSSLI